VTGRLARWLLAESRRAGDARFQLPGARDEIAARLGTVRELVSRSLSRLRGLGLVEGRGRTLRILDPGQLARVAGGAPREPVPPGVTRPDGF
jgi:CRP/FNR family transcriptional regulator